MAKGTPPLPIVIVLGVLGIIGSGASLMLVDSRTAIAVLGVGIVIFLGIALFNSRRDAGKQTGWTSFIIALVYLLLIIGAQADLLQRAFPVCGDGVCASGECAQGCADCTASDCRDGSCQVAIENCATSEDCPCPGGALCAPNRKADPFGCVSVACDDGYCDEGEDSRSCCADCGCAQGFACIRNICLFQEPQVTFQPYLYFHNASVTTLAANPFLTDTKGIGYPLAAIIVKDGISPALGVRVAFLIPPYIHGKVDIGDLHPGESANATWYLDPSPEALAIIDDVNTSINITITYRDLQGDERVIRRSYPFTLYGRNTMDDHGELAFFVTPDDVPTRGRTAHEIWDELRGTIEITPDDGKVQFPIETIAYAQGDATDIAVLLASAYVKAGLDPGFVYSDKGLLIWVRDDHDFAVVDPRKLDEEYVPEQNIGSLQEVQLIHRVWERKFIYPLSLDMKMIPGTSLRTARDLTQTCARTVAEWNVENIGRVPSSLCATSTFTSGAPVDTRTWCFTLQPKETRTLNHGWTNPQQECLRPTATLLVQNATS